MFWFYTVWHKQSRVPVWSVPVVTFKGELWDSYCGAYHEDSLFNKLFSIKWPCVFVCLFSGLEKICWLIVIVTHKASLNKNKMEIWKLKRVIEPPVQRKQINKNVNAERPFVTLNGYNFINVMYLRHRTHSCTNIVLWL